MNIYTILLLIFLFLIVLTYILWQIKKNGLRQFVIECIVYAEDNLTNNKVKFEMVCDRVIGVLPFPFNLIPSTVIANFVQKVFDEVKIALDYKKKDEEK